ncbi:MAG TPA: hypothetical protein VF131_20765 [Blastocatellia bacterium]|nr:hypothetical protein [Blastocatellia bacterium]
MTQRAFQSTVARLVIDPDFRDRVSVHGVIALGSDLTTLERERVMAIVSDKGLDATRTLHKSFRLTKIYTLLPLTRALLGPDHLAKEIDSFWKAELPVSHYFMEEAIAFCDFLRDRICSGLRIKYLKEVIAYERANLELRRPRTNGDVPKPQFVNFDHDPVTLFTQLMNGKCPQVVPALSCLLVGNMGQDGEVQWHISTDGN